MKRIERSGEYTKKITDNKVLGGFIESGFGRQVPGMWGEMIHNRAFRAIPAYKSPTWEWLGFTREMYNENAPFWHSGYEENDWKYVGDTKYGRTCGSETYKGTSSLVLSGRVEGSLHGVAQDGIHLQAGREYQFRIFCGVSEWRHNMGLNGFGSDERRSDIHSLHIAIGDNNTVLDITGVVEEHEWRFTAKSTGVFTLSITYEWKGNLILAYTSLFPADHEKGWRRDVVECLREAGPTVVRFPGGCFTSFYNWRSSVGPREKREPQESYYWGGLEDNDVGLLEFMELSELCGFEGQICFNMMTSTPFDARCMVEYLNAPSDVGYGRLRMLDGHEKPFGVKYFECDNEPNRKWSAKQYAEQCVAFIREMRHVTPDAIFFMAAYAYNIALLPMMLEIAGGDIDYVIYRNGEPEFVAQVLPILREYNQKTGRNIRLCNTEWLASCHSPEPFDVPDMPTDYEWNGKMENDYNKVLSRQEISWNYALNGAHRILDYISYGGEFALANFNNMANTWGQNIVECSKDKAWLSCMGEIFAFFHRNFRPCTACHAETGDDRMKALFTRDEAGREQLYVINHDSKEKQFILPEGFSVAVDGLNAAKRSVYITEKEKPITNVRPEVKDGKVCVPALSVVVFE